MAAKAKSGRFHQVQDFLNAAAGNSDADYGGIGRFWNKDRETLLKATVHGEAMIAPASCCASDSLRKFARLTAREFQSHENVRRELYAREQRWPDEPFWRRRQTTAG